MFYTVRCPEHMQHYENRGGHNDDVISLDGFGTKRPQAYDCPTCLELHARAQREADTPREYRIASQGFRGIKGNKKRGLALKVGGALLSISRPQEEES